MTRLLLALILAATLLAPTSAGAHDGRSHGASVLDTTRGEISDTRHGQVSRTRRVRISGTTAKAHKRIQRLTTNPVALSLKLAERYWHGVPACGMPTILARPRQLPNSDYENVTSPEPANSVVEMWTEVQTCTITINASLWGSWQQDDEFFQWFCDAMTHEVGHLFGHLDSGQTNPSSITYPFLDGTSPNFNSVPECRSVTLQYGQEEIRNEEIFGRR